MNKEIKRRYSKKTKEQVVSAIVHGELWIEEAMEKFHVQDRRTVVSWLRKYLREKRDS